MNALAGSLNGYRNMGRKRLGGSQMKEGHHTMDGRSWAHMLEIYFSMVAHIAHNECKIMGAHAIWHAVSQVGGQPEMSIWHVVRMSGQHKESCSCSCSWDMSWMLMSQESQWHGKCVLVNGMVEVPRVALVGKVDVQAAPWAVKAAPWLSLAAPWAVK